MTCITDPQLSIIVLTYNRHRLLRDCLQSLLEQDVGAEKLELIVADDGSTDCTAQVVWEFQRDWPRLVYVRQSHKGIPATRNLGIHHASSRLIAIVADDYILSADYASTILCFFQENPDAEIVRFKIIASQGDIFSRLSHFYYEISFLNRLLPQPELKRNMEKVKRYFKRLTVPKKEITTQHELEAAGAAAFRREVFDRAGLFDESLLRGEDTDFTLRLKELGIPVYYNPFHEVRHQYSWGCIDTLKKSFIHGVNHYRLYQKHNANQSASEKLSAAARTLIHQFLQAIWRARQIKRTREFFLYFPALLAFEVSVKVGMCWGLLRSHARKDSIGE
ncbi:MAG: glycosyltransferase [Desulfoferrobacter sp.]